MRPAVGRTRQVAARIPPAGAGCVGSAANAYTATLAEPQRATGVPPWSTPSGRPGGSVTQSGRPPPVRRPPARGLRWRQPRDLPRRGMSAARGRSTAAFGHYASQAAKAIESMQAAPAASGALLHDVIHRPSPPCSIPEPSATDTAPAEWPAVPHDLGRQEGSGERSAGLARSSARMYERRNGAPSRTVTQAARRSQGPGAYRPLRQEPRRARRRGRAGRGCGRLR